MSAKDIEVPTGLDLQPRPPVTVRLSKRAGVLAIFLVGGVVATVVFGIYSRQQKQSQPAHSTADDHGIVAATDAGRQIAEEISAKPHKTAEEVAPVDEKLELRSPADTSRERRRPAGNSENSIKTKAIRSRPVQPAAYHSMPRSSYHETTPADKRLQLEYQREQEAIAAPTRVALAGGVQGAPVSSQPSVDLTQIQSLLQGLLGTSAGSAQTFAAKPANPGNQNNTILAELQQKLVSTRTSPGGRYEIKAGWNIPAILEQDINSDLPGEIRALVRENVYDTATGRYLLIPQGARLLGTYNSQVAYGQEVVQVVWSRIIFPDASSIDLNGMVGQDASGASGFRDDVDHHYKRLVGMGLLTSAFSAALQMSQSHRGSTLEYPGVGETAGSAVGQQMSQLGIDVTRRNLDVQPTIKVRAGYRFNVRVNRDLVLDRPYQ